MPRPSGRLTVRGKGINYDTGFTPGGSISRNRFDPGVVRREMQIIATELNCTAVRITGAEPSRLSLAAEQAAAAGLEVWFAPFPCELTADELAPLFAECADRAEYLRQGGAEVVLVTGCELSLFGAGYLPGSTVFERIAGLSAGGPELRAAFAALPARLNGFLAETADAARSNFGGRVTYASGLWEPVDWSPFDIVSVDAYRDAGNADSYVTGLRRQVQLGKPVAITEFGCCTYAGAADRGGLGWTIVDTDAEPPRLDGDYVRDETEQVRYLHELLGIFAAEGVDSAFWFTFAGYDYRDSGAPREDLDLASYGLVKMLAEGQGGGYDDLGWEPKLAFRALARAYARSEAGTV
jgi:hypothetical protein